MSEIAEQNRNYDAWANDQSSIASKLYQINGTIGILQKEASFKNQETQDVLFLSKDCFHENFLCERFTVFYYLQSGCLRHWAPGKFELRTYIF